MSTIGSEFYYIYIKKSTAQTRIIIIKRHVIQLRASGDNHLLVMGNY